MPINKIRGTIERLEKTIPELPELSAVRGSHWRNN